MPRAAEALVDTACRHVTPVLRSPEPRYTSASLGNRAAGYAPSRDTRFPSSLSEYTARNVSGMPAVVKISTCSAARRRTRERAGKPRRKTEEPIQSLGPVWLIAADLAVPPVLRPQSGQKNVASLRDVGDRHLLLLREIEHAPTVPINQVEFPPVQNLLFLPRLALNGIRIGKGATESHLLLVPADNRLYPANGKRPLARSGFRLDLDFAEGVTILVGMLGIANHKEQPMVSVHGSLLPAQGRRAAGQNHIKLTTEIKAGTHPLIFILRVGRPRGARIPPRLP